MAKGDKIVVLYRMGSSASQDSFEARKSGRKVETEIVKESGLAWLEIKEVTRGGTEVASARFQMTEVIAYMRKPKDDEGEE